MRPYVVVVLVVLVTSAITIITYLHVHQGDEMNEGALLVWGSDPLLKIFKDDKPPTNSTATVSVEAVKDEYAAAQFAITSRSGSPVVRIEVEPLRGPAGFEINFSTNFVGYVPVKKNTPNTPSEELVREAPFEAPDPLLEDNSIEVKQGEPQPVWITIFVPADAPSGNYSGKVTVLSSHTNASLTVKLKVYPFTLPVARSLWLTNWFNPDNVARYHNAESWSEEHWLLIGEYAKDMAEHRQNVIITPILDLIKFVKRPDGTLRCDFTNFDRWVELFMSEGVVGRVEGGHLAGRQQWEASDFDSQPIVVRGEDGSILYTQPSMKVSSLEYYGFLQQFLPQLQEHLVERGWIDIYLQHLADEPIRANEASYRQLASYVKELAPRLRTIDANQDTNLVGALDVWVPILHEFDVNQEFYTQRRAAGNEVWFYTCLAPTGRYPNRFIDYPLVKVRALQWINFKYNLTGYLHWGLNYWSADPFQDVEPSNLPPGDAFIIYPGKEGPMNSIRFEVLRLGVQDYELLKLLERIDSQKAKQLADAVISSLTDYVRDAAKFNDVRRALIQSLVERTSAQ